MLLTCSGDSFHIVLNKHNLDLYLRVDSYSCECRVQLHRYSKGIGVIVWFPTFDWGVAADSTPLTWGQYCGPATRVR